MNLFYDLFGFEKSKIDVEPMMIFSSLCSAKIFKYFFWLNWTGHFFSIII